MNRSHLQLIRCFFLIVLHMSEYLCSFATLKKVEQAIDEIHTLCSLTARGGTVMSRLGNTHRPAPMNSRGGTQC